jgi:predicted O-linked N-acetylglucosamine transferase (SPINDLY family)
MLFRCPEALLMIKLFFYNNWHNGDIIFNKPLVRAVLDRHDVEITWGCWRNHKVLIEDLPIRVIAHENDDKQPGDLTVLRPADHYPIYLWVGQYPDTRHTSWKNSVEVYNRQVTAHKLPLQIVSRHVPMVEFPHLDIEVLNNAIYVENGPVRSFQSSFTYDMRALAEAFPNLNFYCTADPVWKAPNLISCAHLNLVQLSAISNRCDAIVGKGSGAFACAMTEVNRFKPQAVMGFKSHDGPTFWEYPGSPLRYLNSQDELHHFLKGVAHRTKLYVPARVEGPPSKPVPEAVIAQIFYQASRWTEEIRHSPQNLIPPEKLLGVRKELADFWLGISDPAVLKTLYLHEGGAAQRLLMAVRKLPAASSPAELARESELRGKCESTGGTGALLAAMLYFDAHQSLAHYTFDTAPDWLREDWARYALQAPEIFREVGEVAAYAAFYRALLRQLSAHLTVTAKDNAAFALAVATSINIIPVYFSPGDLKDIMAQRGQILEHALRLQGLVLEHTFVPADQRPANRKVRIGIAQMQFHHHTETYTALSVFEHLDRSRFEIVLYVLNSNNSDIERYCRSRADHFVQLAGDVRQQIETIRSHDLDVMFFGTNLTAVTHGLVIVAAHRVARVQLTSLNSPVTTGLAAMTHYLVGAAGRSADQVQEGYTEKVGLLPDPGMCFSFPMRPPASGQQLDRVKLGIAADAFVFMAGANFFKIIPELREAWAKMIARVPGSVLVLFPFGPSWSNSYAVNPFMLDMHAAFQKQGLSPSQLIVVAPFPSPSDIPPLLAIADLYVDSFPYAGATSIIDALLVSLPTVVMAGEYQRFDQAAALLRELGLEELIAKDVEDYLRLTTEFATNKESLKKRRDIIKSKLAGNPHFLDAKWYAREVEKQFDRMLGELPASQ